MLKEAHLAKIHELYAKNMCQNLSMLPTEREAKEYFLAKKVLPEAEFGLKVKKIGLNDGTCKRVAASDDDQLIRKVILCAFTKVTLTLTRTQPALSYNATPCLPYNVPPRFIRHR